MPSVAGDLRSGRDSKDGGDILWDAAAPEAVEVDVRPEVDVFRREPGVGRAGMGRVILALDGVAEENHELDRGVGVDGEVKVAARHLVDFIYDEGARGLEQRGLPGAETPLVLVAWLHEAFPFVSQLGRGNG